MTTHDTLYMQLVGSHDAASSPIFKPTYLFKPNWRIGWRDPAIAGWQSAERALWFGW
jgi:hypothetical protein